MEKCRICLGFRKKLLSIYTKVDGITFAEMITSLANIKIKNEDGKIYYLCRSCRGKLTEAYNFKKDIERSEMVLQETTNMKRISFSNLNDIKIKIEIETDLKPVLPAIENISENLFKDGTDCISYNNTVIKKVRQLSDDNENSKSLSVVEFLNSIKTETDDCFYEDYVIGADDDSGSNFSVDMSLALRKTKKNNRKKIKKVKRKSVLSKNDRTIWSKHPRINPIKPKYLDDLRLARTKGPINRKKQAPKSNNRTPAKSICPYCGKLCKSLNTHILQHTAEKEFKCDLCAKEFFTIATLNKHKKTHSLTKDFKCEHCIAAFNNKASLQSHMIMHRDEKKHICGICSKSFKRKPLLTRHMNIHNFGSRHIKCELCPMSFYTPSSFRHHMRVHTGERPFKCEICSQPYSYKHDFNRHCLKKHGVFLKRRSVRVMNEEVLQQERALMRDLTLRAHGVIKDGEFENPFDGPQAALAYEQAIKAIQDNKIPTVLNNF